MPFRIPIFQSQKKQADQLFITVVSGLPRSGTSMMMKMLEAGGIPVLTDHQRAADENNPRGYYEFDRVKQLRTGDLAWLEDARGKAVKIISALLEYLPSRFSYKVIFMQRDLGEVVASQRKMLDRIGEDAGPASDEKMRALFQDHLVKVEAWLKKQPSVDTVFVNYNKIISEPDILAQVERFLGRSLDTSRMAQIVDQNLYRERRG